MADYTAIDDPTAYFQCELWTGNGSNRSITLSGNSDLQPDMVWLKQRSGTENHNLYDSVRGAGKRIIPNLNNNESTTNELTAFNTDGFSLADGDEVNKSSSTYVSWNWKSGTAFSNDASATSVGSIDSSGSVSTTAGFSIIKWDGTDANGTVAHGLGVVPKMILFKTRGADESWIVYHPFLGNTKYLNLNNTNAISSATANMFNSTSPTSTTFSVGANSANKNTTMIAYCFAEKQGYSKFGSYTGNGNADGTFNFLGFKPAFFMVKQTNASGQGWGMFDNKRDPHNVTGVRFWADTAEAESTGQAMDFLSNGFKIRATNAYWNASGGSYIYMAFAENPFVTSTGIPATAR